MLPFAILFILFISGLSAQSAPTLTVNNTTLKFTATIGAVTLPAAQTLAVQSTPTGLGYTVAVTGPAPYYGAWLLVAVSSGRAPQTQSVQVNPTGLAAGSYTGTITFTGTSGSPLPTATTIVTLTVASPAPTITVSPTSLNFTYTTSLPIAGNSALSSRFILSNTGTATAATVSVQSAPWLKVSPAGNITLAGLLNSIAVSVDPTGLAPKVYTANITIKAAAAANPTLTLPVTMTVVAARPTVSNTWPVGVIQQSPQSVITLYGQNYFPNSTVSATGLTTEATVSVTDGVNTANESFFIPVFTSASTGLRVSMGSPLPGATVGAAYTPLTLAAAGGTPSYSWIISGGALPPGLFLSAGQIGGTPSAAGTYYFTVSVTDSASPITASAYMPVKMVVLPNSVPPAPRIRGPSTMLPAGTMAAAYAGGIAATAIGGVGPYTWSAVNLPPGLIINPSTGVISGTPSSVGVTGPLTAKQVGENAILVTIPSANLVLPGLLRLAISTPTPGGGISNDGQFQIFGPQPQLTGVADAASFTQGMVSPGQIVSIFGLGLGPSALTLFNPALPAPQIPNSLPATAPATSVTVNGTAAPILYTSVNQVSVVVPYTVTGTTADFVLSYGGLASQPVSVGLAPTGPGVFTTDASGRGQGAILNYNAASSDYSLNSSASPAAKGQIIVIYVNGMGTTNTNVANTLIPSSPAVTPNAPVSVTIGGIPASILGAASPVGSVPGLLQVNVTVPSTAPTGAVVPVIVNIGGIDSQAGVTMAVR